MEEYPDYPKDKIGARIHDMLGPVTCLYEAAHELSDKEGYNLVLHKHLGDVLYALAAKTAFEGRYRKPLRFIVRPKHAFVAEMLGIENFRVLDLDSYVIRNAKVRRALVDKANPDDMDIDCVENWLFQAVFSCVPLLGQPFVCENNVHMYFDENFTCGIGTYRQYWAYRWAANMGVHEDFKFPLATKPPEYSEIARGAMSKLGPADRIVVFAPDAITAARLEDNFWRILAEAVIKQGFTIVVNSSKVKIAGTYSAIDLGFSLSDVVKLCLECSYVFSLRSGLCDVIASIGGRLYAFYPAMLNREMGGLNFVFRQDLPVHEIQLLDWTISQVIWEGIDLTARLQKDINRLKAARRKASFKHRFDRRHREHWWYTMKYYEDIAWQPRHEDYNGQKHALDSSRESNALLRLPS